METLAWMIAGASTAAAGFFAWQWGRAARRAASDREADAAQSAAEKALAASDERARIAREMHDVVAHTLSVVVAQSDGGRFAARKDKAAATRALEVVGEVSRAALTEMRALLGVLRDTDSAVDLGPQPSLDDIPTLVNSVRDGGLEVSYVTTGTPRPLPIGAGLALYRIVQEALTNVLKHGGPKVAAIVQMRWTPGAVEAKITDDGRGAAATEDGGGTGLEGMRERATVFGGTLRVGPKAGGGYVVKATLPLTPRATKEDR